jgi:hypothetical protein
VKTTLVTAALVSVLWFGPLWADDSSNTNKESNLNQIYQTYNASPTDERVWSLVAGQTGQRSYKTQKGDTLWEISEMLFGDGNFWPKVWALNKDITDPHDVPPGTMLTFFPGSMSEAPQINFDSSKAQPEVAPEVLALTLNVEIPPPKRESAPPITTLPPSFPQWRFKKDPSEFTKMDITPISRAKNAPAQYLTYYIEQGSFEGEGTVVGAELGMESASEYQYLFVNVPNASENKNYIAVKEIGQVEDPVSHAKGMVIQVQGLLETTAAVDSSKGTYRALVKKSISRIETGAKLLSTNLPVIDINETGHPGQAEARIFGGQFGISRRLFGPDGIVFLNQGNRAGLTAGQTLPIYKNQGIRTDKNPIRENPRVIGRLKIVRTTEDLATAVIISANEEIRVGDGTSAEIVVRAGSE